MCVPQVLTGESWSEAIVRPLIFGFTRTNAVVVGVFFTSYILLTQVVLQNVVVAVLLDKFVEDPEGDKDKDGGGAGGMPPFTPEMLAQLQGMLAPPQAPADTPSLAAAAEMADSQRRP